MAGAQPVAIAAVDDFQIRLIAQSATHHRGEIGSLHPPHTFEIDVSGQVLVRRQTLGKFEIQHLDGSRRIAQQPQVIPLLQLQALRVQHRVELLEHDGVAAGQAKDTCGNKVNTIATAEIKAHVSTWAVEIAVVECEC